LTPLICEGTGPGESRGERDLLEFDTKILSNRLRNPSQ
jgi:hypothetical protein